MGKRKEEIEWDPVFKMPPKETYRILITIKSDKKAVPKFVKQEGG